MHVKKYLMLFLILSGVIEIKSQIQDSSYLNTERLNWFISFNCGAQMSGIKDEDFVSSNFTPLFNVKTGKWFSPLIAIQIGYKGFYFNYIDDDLKHKYNYLYTETVFNLLNVINPDRKNKKWSLLPHAGFGIFRNQLLNKTQACLNIGIQNNYFITNNVEISIDFSSIIGWRIYQADEDILPSLTVGLNYFL